MKIGLICPGGRLETWHPFIKAIALNNSNKVILVTDTLNKNDLNELVAIKNQFGNFEYFVEGSSFASLIKYDAVRFLTPKIINSLIGVDVIHVIGDPSYLQTWQAYRFAKKHGIAFTCRAAQNVYRKFPFPFSYIEGLILKNADLIFPLHEQAEQILVKKGLKVPTCFLNNGFDDDLFSITQSNIMTKCDNSQLTLGFVGSIARHKGILLLLELLTKTNLNIHFKMVGNLFGADINEANINHLINKVNSESDNRVTWLKRQPYSELPMIFRGFDILILPSIDTNYIPNTIAKYIPYFRMPWSEQFGRVLVEAMALGVPVIGSNAGGIPYVIGNDSYVYDQNDISKAFEIVNRLKIQSNYEKARKYAIERSKAFTWNIVATKAIGEWERLVLYKGH